MPDGIDPFDELAAMFLTTPTQPSSQSSSAHSSATAESSRTTELLMVGHLPVRAGLWLTPYSDSIARDEGTVALLRIEDEELSMQLVRAPERCESMSYSSTMSQAIEQVGPIVDAWIVQVPTGLSTTDLLNSNIDRITILTGSNEAAVVSAYRVIKDLSECAESAHSTLPAIGLAVVGCDQSEARAVLERLNRTTVSFLGVEVKLVKSLPRIEAGIKSTRYISFRDAPAPSFHDIMAWVEHAKVQPSIEIDHSAIAGRVHTDLPGRSVKNAEEILRSAPPIPPRPVRVDVPRRKPEPVAPVASREPNGTPEPPRPAHIKLPPKPSIELEPKTTLPVHEPDDHGQPVPLANYVGDLTLLPVRAPSHERIEIAIDRKGRLHLVGREATMRDMTIVEHWTRSHRELIAMACQQHEINYKAGTVCHVFTDTPATLSDLNATTYHLHVLAPVNVDGKTGWYSAPLNVVG